MSQAGRESSNANQAASSRARRGCRRTREDRDHEGERRARKEASPACKQRFKPACRLGHEKATKVAVTLNPVPPSNSGAL